MDGHDRHVAAERRGRRRRRGTAGPSRRASGRPRGRSPCSSRRRSARRHGRRSGASPWCARSGWRPSTSADSGRRDAVAEEVVGRGGDEHAGGATARGSTTAAAACRRGCGGWRRRSPVRRRPSRRSRPSTLGLATARSPGARRLRAEQPGDRAGERGPTRCRSSRRALRLGERLDAGRRGRARNGNVATWARPRLRQRRRTGRRSQSHSTGRSLVRRRPHVTSAMRMGGLCRWVIVGVRPDDVGRHLERVVQRRRGHEAEAAHGPRVAADDDHPAEVLQRVRAPVPHVERVDAVVGVARPVQVAVPLVLGELLLVTRPRSRSGSVVSASTCSKKSM